MKIKLLLLSLVAFVFVFAPQVHSQSSGLLTPEEILWLESRNNTLIVYPEKNNPPLSYTSAGGNIQGLAIDYIELIAEKIDVKAEYLLPQSRSRVISDFLGGKGDLILALTETHNRTNDFIFTDSYVTVPTVIVVRKDYGVKGPLNLTDFNGKRVSMVADSALEEYVRENYPRVVVEDVTDDEVNLQQVILGEVDAAVLDISSLSFYLSKQVLSSVKVVGNTGLDYKLAFALRKDQAILQDILGKAMTQISTADRELLTEKWVGMPTEGLEQKGFSGFLQRNVNAITLYVLAGIVLFVVAVLLLKHRHVGILHHRLHKAETMNALKEEFTELEKANKILEEEMKMVRAEEEKLQEKIQSLDNKPSL